ncbi:MAG: amidohydrolase [Prevotellaceae bacterium]|jgi:predicted amidohydrolase|nr:amidohydrolase [Prevotellaceae bacterium]
MKIALLQTDIVWEDRQANLQYCMDRINTLPDDVQLVMLPEMFSTGFSMQPEKLAETEEGATLEWLRETAVRKAVAIAGSVIAEERRKYFNRLFFVFPDGSYKKYDKRHLFSMSEEPQRYTAGVQRLVVEYGGWRICPLICYDLRFPVWSRNCGSVYDLLLYVANWPAARINAWDALLPARAIENHCYVAGVNRCGQDGAGIAHNGHSQVIDYKGTVIAAAGNDEETLIATLSLEKLNSFRAKFPVGKDADAFILKDR